MAEHGYVEVGCVDEITTRMPGPDEARTLALDTGTPVLVYVRTSYTDSRPLRSVETIFAGDRKPDRLRTRRPDRPSRRAAGERVVIIEPAGITDLPSIIAMREEASAWLHERGIEQWRQPWPNHDAMVERITASIRAGETWMTRDHHGATTGTVAPDTHADPLLWTPDERDQPAMYLHRLMIRRRWAGLGAHILDWAIAKAGHQGNHWVRIDVWTHNEPLHKYYLRHGFGHVRTRDQDDYPSGTLFQRPTGGAVPRSEVSLSDHSWSCLPKG